MTSSLNESSDNSGEGVELLKNPEPQTASSPATEISHPGVPASTVQYGTPPQLIAGNAMVQAAYPYPDPYYRNVFSSYDAPAYSAQPYPAQSMVHLQLMGIQQAGVPLSCGTVEEPVFVNAKQYHGIMRRRQSRAKAESENKSIKSRKPYLHESRHQHALRRARGNGGRFLNAKKDENQRKEASSDDRPEVNLNLNSDKNRIASSENRC